MQIKNRCTLLTNLEEKNDEQRMGEGSNSYILGIFQRVYGSYKEEVRFGDRFWNNHISSTNYPRRSVNSRAVSEHGLIANMLTVKIFETLMRLPAV